KHERSNGELEYWTVGCPAKETNTPPLHHSTTPCRPLKKEIHILMLEDNPADAELASETLRRGGVHFNAIRVDNEKEFVREIDERPPDVILSDYALPGFDGYAALEIAKQKCPFTPFICVTGTMGEEVAIETLKTGATDY